MARRKRYDEGHELTEKELLELERRIASVYKDAADELQETIDAYFDSFAKQDAETKALIGTVVNGREYTEQDYQQWRLAQIGRGKRFEALRDRVAQRYTKANETAVAYTNDATPGIYSLNRNYAAYTIEQVAGNVGFDLWDEQTVKRLIVEQPDLMPYYPPKRALQRGIDLAWGKKQITASVTSSILQGKSIKHMADDLQSRIKTMNRDSAIRSARTAVTGAQNAGRMDSYVAAQKMGIELEREWLATLDNRTRHQHAMMDGHKAPIDKPFIMDGHKIMYPGDMSAPGYLVYNCRCTLVAAVKGVDTSKAKRRARDPETGETALIENMSYAEWAGWKDSLKGKSSVDRTPSDGTTRNYTKNIAKILGVDEKNIQISELPEVSQASIEKQVNQAVDYFPQLKGHLKSIKYSDKIADGTIALSHSIAGTIDVGPAFLDYDTLAKKYAYGVKIGQYAKGTTVDSILMHEMGHQVDGLLTKNGLFDGEIGMYGTIRSSQAIQNDILDVLGLSAQRLKDIRQEYRDKGYTGKDLTHAVLTERKWFIEEHVSGYAATNEREFLAECFSELVTSEHPREAAQELGKILEIAKGIL